MSRGFWTFKTIYNQPFKCWVSKFCLAELMQSIKVVKMRLVNLTESRWPKIGWNMTKKCSQRQTLFFEFDRNLWHRQTLTFPPQKYAGAVGSDMSASFASPIPPLLYKKKTSGTEVRRTLEVRLRFLVVNFSRIQ